MRKFKRYHADSSASDSRKTLDRYLLSALWSNVLIREVALAIDLYLDQ